MILCVIALSLSSCGVRIIDYSKRNNSYIETLKDEDIELRNQFRNQRQRDRKNHNNRSQ